MKDSYQKKGRTDFTEVLYWENGHVEEMKDSYKKKGLTDFTEVSIGRLVMSR